MQLYYVTVASSHITNYCCHSNTAYICVVIIMMSATFLQFVTLTSLKMQAQTTVPHKGQGVEATRGVWNR